VKKRKPSCAATKLTLFAVEKNGTPGTVTPRRMHYMYCGMPKGTSRAEAMLNSEKIKCVALACIAKLCWSEGIRQAGS